MSGVGMPENSPKTDTAWLRSQYQPHSYGLPLTNSLPSDYFPTNSQPSNYFPANYLPSDYSPTNYLPSDYFSTYSPKTDTAGPAWLRSQYQPHSYGLPLTNSLPSDYFPTNFFPSSYFPANYLPSDYSPTNYLPSDYFSTYSPTSDYFPNILRKSVSSISKPIKPQDGVSSGRTSGNQHSNYSAQTKNSHHSVSDIRPPEKSLMAQAASSSISMSQNKSSSNVPKPTTDSSYSISKVHPIERSVMAQTAASSIRSEIQPYPNFAESTTGSYYSISDVRPTERSRVAQAAASSIRSDHQSYSGFSASATYSISQVRPKEKSQIAAMPISMSLNQLYSNSTTSNRVDSISDIRRMEKSVGARAAATYESHSKISKSTSKLASSKKSS